VGGLVEIENRKCGAGNNYCYRSHFEAATGCDLQRIASGTMDRAEG